MENRKFLSEEYLSFYSKYCRLGKEIGVEAIVSFDEEKIANDIEGFRKSVESLPDSQFWKILTPFHILFLDNGENFYSGQIIREYFKILQNPNLIDSLQIILPIIRERKEQLNKLLKEIFYYYEKAGISLSFNEEGQLLIKSYGKVLLTSDEYFGANMSLYQLMGVLNGIAFLRGVRKDVLSKYRNIGEDSIGLWSLYIPENAFREAIQSLKELPRNKPVLTRLEDVLCNEIFRTLFYKTSIPDVENYWSKDRVRYFSTDFRILSYKKDRQFFKELKQKLEEAIIKNQFSTPERKIFGSLLYLNMVELGDDISLQAFSKAFLTAGAYLASVYSNEEERILPITSKLTDMFYSKVFAFAEALITEKNLKEAQLLPVPKIKKKERKAKVIL